MRRADGSSVWINLTVRLVRDALGELAERRDMAIDITERKYAEQALPDATTRIEGRGEELALANASLHKADKAKSGFLANVSHELRTLINATLGFAQLLENPAFGDLNAKQRRFVANIRTNDHHLLQLINDLIDLSTLEREKAVLDFAQVSAKECLTECRQLVTGLAAEKGITNRVKYPAQGVTIYEDARRIRQISLNLLNNGVKFTPEDGRISLEGSVVDDEVHIRVRDTGVGISAK